MKSGKYVKFGIGGAFLAMTVIAFSCSGGSGSGVTAAIVKEEAKEKAEVFIAEHDVPYDVVDAFNKANPQATEHQWLIYQADSVNKTPVELPAEYIVAYKKNEQSYHAKYSKEGNRTELLRLNTMDILPDQGLKYINAHYKDWKTVTVYEKLDVADESTKGFIVTMMKDNQKEKIFFDIKGNVVKIQTLE